MSIGRVYTLQFNGSAITTQCDLFEVVAASSKIVRLLELHLSQSTEVGDAMEEGLSILVKSGATSAGNGTVTAPVPLNFADTAFGAGSNACRTVSGTKATGGTIVTHFAYNWNVRAPLDYYYPLFNQVVIPPSGRLTVELGTTPADSITCNGYLMIEEV